MTENPEKIEQESWFSRNLNWAFFIGLIVSHNFISEWISFPVYLGAGFLFYANILYFISKNKNPDREWFIANGWLKTNLFILAVMGGWYLAMNGLVYLSALVPESVAATFPAILVIGLILYLIGVGFYLVEKAIKN